MLCEETINHRGKCKHLFTCVNTCFVSQEERQNPYCSPTSWHEKIRSSRACLFHPEGGSPLQAHLGGNFRRNKFLRYLQPVSVAWYRVLGSLLGVDIYTEKFQTVREQGGKNRIYPYKEKNSKLWALLDFVSGWWQTTQWVCVFQVFLAKLLDKATWDSKPSLPNYSKTLTLYWYFTVLWLEGMLPCWLVLCSDYENTIFWAVRWFVAAPGDVLLLA